MHYSTWTLVLITFSLVEPRGSQIQLNNSVWFKKKIELKHDPIAALNVSLRLNGVIKIVLH